MMAKWLCDHDDEWLNKGVELACQHHVNEDDGDHEGKNHVVKGFAELLSAPGHADLVAQRQQTFGGRVYHVDGLTQ